MTGYWSWEFIDTATGDTTKSYANSYLWGVIPGPNPAKLWVVYSTEATNWNLGYTDITGTTPLLRNDLTIGLLDTASLQLTQAQQLPGQIRPVLKLFYYQSTDSQATNGGWGNKLFSIPVGTGQPDQFLLATGSGFSLLSYSGGSWRETAKYDGAGNPIGTATPTPTPIPGDANGDGKVDGVDYAVWLAHYDQTTNNGARDGDFNGDKRVDGIDYTIWLNNYQ